MCVCVCVCVCNFSQKIRRSVKVQEFIAKFLDFNRAFFFCDKFYISSTRIKDLRLFGYKYSDCLVTVFI